MCVCVCVTSHPTHGHSVHGTSTKCLSYRCCTCLWFWLLICQTGRVDGIHALPATRRVLHHRPESSPPSPCYLCKQQRSNSVGREFNKQKNIDHYIIIHLHTSSDTIRHRPTRHSMSCGYTATLGCVGTASWPLPLAHQPTGSHASPETCPHPDPTESAALCCVPSWPECAGSPWSSDQWETRRNRERCLE